MVSVKEIYFSFPWNKRTKPKSVGEKPMKIAVVHEWLIVWARAERVLREVLGLFPGRTLGPHRPPAPYPAQSSPEGFFERDQSRTSSWH
jgi:hypothetical protein